MSSAAQLNPETHCDLAYGYAQDVVSGKIPACLYVRQACQRQLDDLVREDWEYSFIVERAEHICRFIEKLPHIKGKWARERKLISLEPWQVFILTTVFGWVDIEGNRRFNTAYNELPRKSAKSTLSSGVALYCLVADYEAGAEVYSAATTREQAKIVWDDAKRMVDKSPGLRGRFAVKTLAHTINVDRTSSIFRPLSRDQGGNLDGLNVHCGVIDELHAHKTREVFDVIETGTGAREQSLLWLITTAGFNRAGICYEQRDYLIKILKGAISDENYFGIIYTIDEDDVWTEPDSWIKANPNWGISVNPDDIARKARKAIQTASAQPNFLTKHLNVWVNAESAWMDMLSWDKCADSGLTLESFKGQECWIAIDLASKIDIASVGIVFRHGGGYAVFTKNYLPEEAANEGRNSQYQGWAIEGRLITTPGNATDYAYIEEDIRQLAANHTVIEVGYDPWQSAYIATRLMEEGLPMVEVRQTVANMSEPMKELEALTVSGNLAHTGDPVLTWMISNVVAHLDKKDNIYPNKEFMENKIDGVVALIMAMSLAMNGAAPKEVDWMIG